MPTSVISGFVAGDTIDLRGVGFTSSSTATLDQNNALHVSAGGSSYLLQFDLSQDYSGQSFYLSSDGHGGTDVEVGKYKLVFAFSQSLGSSQLIQAGNLKATLYFNDKPIGQPLSQPASCDDAFPLISSSEVTLPSPQSLVSPTITANGNPTIVFNINNLAGGS